MSWVDLYQISHRASRPVARKTVIIEPQVFTPDEGTSSMVVTRPVNQPTTQQYPNREQRANTCRTIILRTVGLLSPLAELPLWIEHIASHSRI